MVTSWRSMRKLRFMVVAMEMTMIRVKQGGGLCADMDDKAVADNIATTRIIKLENVNCFYLKKKIMMQSQMQFNVYKCW